MCNRLLDDLLVSFYYSMFEIEQIGLTGTIILISTADFPLMHERSISNKLCTISNKNRAFEIVQNREKLHEIERSCVKENTRFYVRAHARAGSVISRFTGLG